MGNDVSKLKLIPFLNQPKLELSMLGIYFKMAQYELKKCEQANRVEHESAI